MTTDTYTFTGNERESVAFTPTLDGTVYNCQVKWNIAAQRWYCQQRVKSDPLTATTNGLILIHLVYSGLASAITPAFRFCFSR
ncbi:hypothetical protein [Klebsiella pneumoniae]|uniref:hypothetical protein n=1 Tax=Klebsiella pneumoniae TaxID=573 RepID=UPI00273828A3|nr:hypothetical protein [Klebsiella pneumoniae]